jgi:hypothetical protein
MTGVIAGDRLKARTLVNQRNRSDAEIDYLRYNVYIAYKEAFPNGDPEYTRTRRDR